MRALLAVMILTVLAVPASAQGMSGGRKHQRSDESQALRSKTPKADDQAYKSGLEQVPNKQFDPWQNMRATTPAADVQRSK
jgi:hypothetical protein